MITRTEKPNMTKKDFTTMRILSENLTPYEVTVWLATPNKKLDNKSPYDMIKLGRSERVYAAAYDRVKEEQRWKRSHKK